jgi:glyoxylase-like metal-dependent hydrolase (beta-lactamase superfamily II)
METERTRQLVDVFETSSGHQIFRISQEVFPGFWGYSYLVRLSGAISQHKWILIDTGSGFGESNAHLEQGLTEVSENTGMKIGFQDLDYILITHVHIDHMGGAPFLRERTGARLGVHELDRRILTNYEERLSIIGRRLGDFLIEAGAPAEQREQYLVMYRLTKGLFRSVEIDFTFEEAGMQVGPFKLLHVPGHSAGHVAIRLDDVLFSGDHVLDDTSPHQAPERLSLSTGLDHYLHSLQELDNWAEDIRLTLGGHKAPIHNLKERINQIRDMHMSRLETVKNMLETPRTVYEVSKILFGDAQGYHQLLAVEEAGAHIEYLYQRGLIEIANLADLEIVDYPIPVLYRFFERKSIQERIAPAPD